MTLWEKVYFGNTLQTWLTALAVMAAALMVMWTLKNVIARYFSSIVLKEVPDVQAMVVKLRKRTRLFFLIVFAIYFGSLSLALPQIVNLWIKTLCVIFLIIQAGLWLDTVILFWLRYYQKIQAAEDAARATTIRILSFVVRLAIYSVVLILILDNLPGIEISTLLASLGIGGIAVALAVQNILSDLFASLSITFDQPFVIGDFIVVGDFYGTVESIGLKTTRLRSLSGEQLIFSNNDLLSSRIRNYKRMSERRVVFPVGVTYQTAPEQVRNIPVMIRRIIEGQDGIRFDRAHFKAYGDFALIFETVYYVLKPDYNEYMNIQQTINLAIYEQFREKGIEFAYPTQTLFIQGGTDGPAAERN